MPSRLLFGRCFADGILSVFLKGSVIFYLIFVTEGYGTWPGLKKYSWDIKKQFTLLRKKKCFCYILCFYFIFFSLNPFFLIFAGAVVVYHSHIMLDYVQKLERRGKYGVQQNTQWHIPQTHMAQLSFRVDHIQQKHKYVTYHICYIIILSLIYYPFYSCVFNHQNIPSIFTLVKYNFIYNSID